jgi:hypothetical protein
MSEPVFLTMPGFLYLLSCCHDATEGVVFTGGHQPQVAVPRLMIDVYCCSCRRLRALLWNLSASDPRITRFNCSY